MWLHLWSSRRQIQTRSYFHWTRRTTQHCHARENERRDLNASSFDPLVHSAESSSSNCEVLIHPELMVRKFKIRIQLLAAFGVNNDTRFAFVPSAQRKPFPKHIVLCQSFPFSWKRCHDVQLFFVEERHDLKYHLQIQGYDLESWLSEKKKKIDKYLLWQHCKVSRIGGTNRHVVLILGGIKLSVWIYGVVEDTNQEGHKTHHAVEAFFELHRHPTELIY